MKIALAVPVLNQKELTQSFLDNLRETETERLPIVFIDNGSTEFIRTWIKGLRDGDNVIRNEENFGVLRALNQAYQILKDSVDYIFYTHNDVVFYEKGWDAKISRILDANPDVGVAGFYGAKGIGTGDIYRSPYRMQQMVRIENVCASPHMDMAVHGFRHPYGEVEPVAVMDGFSLIVSTKLLKKIGGFDRTFPPHHMYDNDICLESLDKGFRNIVIAMDVQHLGGRTDVNEDWSKPFGKSKQDIHTEAHPIFYKKWAPDMVKNGVHQICMPVRV